MTSSLEPILSVGLPIGYHERPWLKLRRRLGHFYFTKLLLPALLKGAKSSPDGTARVVNTSSSASLFTSKIDFNTLKDSPTRRRVSPNSLYAQSKLVSLGSSHHMNVLRANIRVHSG